MGRDLLCALVFLLWDMWRVVLFCACKQLSFMKGFHWTRVGRSFDPSAGHDGCESHPLVAVPATCHRDLPMRAADTDNAVTRLVMLFMVHDSDTPESKGVSAFPAYEFNLQQEDRVGIAQAEAPPPHPGDLQRKQNSLGRL